MNHEKPNPRPMSPHTASQLTIDNVTEYKQIFCKRYIRCLTLAANEKWPNFDCRSCNAFEEVPREVLEQEAKSIQERLFVFHSQKP